MPRAQIALIIPLGDAPGYIPGLHPDQGLPGGGEYPDQGLPGRPPYPSQGPVRPGGRPPHPSHPIAPGGRPVDPDYGWGSERPDQGFNPAYPDQGLPPELGPPVGPTHPWVPPAGEELPPPPEDIADQVVVAVWRPDEQAWKVVIAQGPHPVPHG